MFVQGTKIQKFPILQRKNKTQPSTSTAIEKRSHTPTGKNQPKRAIPQWLATPPLSIAITEAASRQQNFWCIKFFYVLLSVVFQDTKNK